MKANLGERWANGFPPNALNLLDINWLSNGWRSRTGGSPFGPRKNLTKSIGERRTGRTLKGTGARSPPPRPVHGRPSAAQSDLQSLREEIEKCPCGSHLLLDSVGCCRKHSPGAFDNLSKLRMPSTSAAGS